MKGSIVLFVLVALAIVAMLAICGCSEDPKDPRKLIVDLYNDPGDDFDLKIRDSNGQQIAESSNTGTHDQASVWIDPDDYVKVYVYAYSGSGNYNLYFSGDYDDSRSGYLEQGNTIYYQLDW